MLAELECTPEGVRVAVCTMLGVGVASVAVSVAVAAAVLVATRVARVFAAARVVVEEVDVTGAAIAAAAATAAARTVAEEEVVVVGSCVRGMLVISFTTGNKVVSVFEPYIEMLVRAAATTKTTTTIFRKCTFLLDGIGSAISCTANHAARDECNCCQTRAARLPDWCGRRPLGERHWVRLSGGGSPGGRFQLELQLRKLKFESKLCWVQCWSITNIRIDAHSSHSHHWVTN